MLDLLIFLVDKRGYSYYVDASGNVQLSYTPVPVNHAPINHEMVKISIGRSETYFGLERNYATPFEWVKDAQAIISWLLFTQGSEADVTLRVYLTDKTFGEGLKSKLLVETGLKLSKAKWQIEKIITDIREGGVVKLFRNMENTDLEIPIDADPEFIYILMDGLEFQGVRNWTVDGATYETIPDHGYLPVPVYTAPGELEGVGVIGQSQNPAAPFNVFDGFLRWAQTTTVRFKGKLSVTPNFAVAQMNIGLFKILDDGSRTAIQAISYPDVNEQKKTVEYDIEVTYNANEQLYVEVGGIPKTIGQMNAQAFTFEETKFTATFKTVYPPSFIKALRGKTLFRRLLQKGIYSAVLMQSGLLDAIGSNNDIAFASGDAVRGFTNTAITTSFNKFFRFTHMRHCAGFGFEMNNDNQLVATLERRNYWLQDNIVLNLGEVADMEVRFADERLYNTIKIGSPNTETEDVNGRDAFNVTQQYSTPITSEVKELDLTTDYITDMYPIELLRINYEGKTTTDSKIDKQVVALHISNTKYTGNLPDGTQVEYYKLKRGPYTSISGLLSPSTAFNVELSPKTNLLNHGYMLAGYLHFHKADAITYRTSDKNAELSYTIGGKTITEKADIHIGDLQGQKILPFMVNIKASSSAWLIDIANKQLRGKIQWTYKGVIYNGWAWDISFNPADPETLDWMIIPSTDCDFTKLLNV